MNRFELDLDKLPAPYSVTVNDADGAGGLLVLIGLRSAEDALTYAEHFGAPIEADTERPVGHCVMRSVSATRAEPGVTVFIAGSSLVEPEAAVAR